MERAPLRTLRRHDGNVVVLILLAFLLFSVSCTKAVVSFGALLEIIDSSPQTAPAELFLQAATLALSTEDQIRLLKRASIRTPDSYADIASAVARRSRVSETVGLVALDALLAANRFAESLEIFNGTLDASVWPTQFAEVLILAFRNGNAPDVPIERLIASADATDDGRFLVFAAAQAMTKGDRATARTLLVDSSHFSGSMQSNTSYILLWDAGAIELLSNLPPDPSDPLQIAVCADADYLIGDTVSASASWAYLVKRFPTWSWKPYIALARLTDEGTNPESMDWPHAPPSDAWAVRSAPLAVEELLYSEAFELFSDSAEASLERARWLHYRNRSDEALDVVSRLTGEVAAAARLEYGLPDRAVPEALRLVAEYPDSAFVIDAALEALARAGSWDRFNELAEKCRVEGIATRRSWFWESLMLVLHDDTIKAAQVILRYGPDQSGYAGVFNLGILELAANRPSHAMDAFMIAVSLAHDSSEKANAYVRVGDALQMARLPHKAVSAYEAALGVDPESREARSRLMRLAVNH